jgi:cytoskeletal protein CcmA (bactofilin family)
MSFWRKNGAIEKGTPNHSLSIIGEKAHMEGTLQIPGNLRIEGTFHGQVTVGNRMVIAEGAHVQGTLRAKELLIAGSFQGEIIDTHHVEVTSTAKVRGTIQSQRLEIQGGAILLLRCEIGEVGQVPAVSRSDSASHQADPTAQKGPDQAVSAPSDSPVKVVPPEAPKPSKGGAFSQKAKSHG